MLPGAMDFLQFSLFFAAVVVGFLLVLARARRTEPHLRELARLKGIEERLGAIEVAVKAIHPEVLADRLDEIRRELVSALAEAQQPPAVLVGPGERGAAKPGGPVQGLRDLVEARLYAMGYQRVRILTDLRDADPLEEHRVSVECSREEVVHKGSVTLRNGAVLEARLSSILQVFP